MTLGDGAIVLLLYVLQSSMTQIPLISVHFPLKTKWIMHC